MYHYIKLKMLPDRSQLLGQRWRIVRIVGSIQYCWHAYIGPAMSQPLHTNSLIFFCNRFNVILTTTCTHQRYFREVGPTVALCKFACLLFGITTRRQSETWTVFSTVVDPVLALQLCINMQWIFSSGANDGEAHACRL